MPKKWLGEFDHVIGRDRYPNSQTDRLRAERDLLFLFCDEQVAVMQRVQHKEHVSRRGGRAPAHEEVCKKKRHPTTLIFLFWSFISRSAHS